MNNELLYRLQLEAGGSHYPTINPDMQRRFAELIVRECIAKVEEAAEYSPELYGVALDIAEHFGM